MLLHLEVVCSNVDENGGHEAIRELALGTLGLLGVEDGMLLEKVEAQHGFLVGGADRAGRLQQIIYLGEVVVADLEARVHDRVDLVEVLRQLRWAVSRQEGAAEDRVRHVVVPLERVEHSLQVLLLLAGVHCARLIAAQDALVTGTE